MKDYTDIILAPVVTEKSSAAAGEGIYTFKVKAENNAGTDIKNLSIMILGNSKIWLNGKRIKSLFLNNEKFKKSFFNNKKI